jgi:hypothetical protein
VTRRLNERQVDALLEGRPISGREDLRQVEHFIAAVRDSFATDAAPVPRGRLATLLAAGASDAAVVRLDARTRRRSRTSWTSRRAALLLAAALGALMVATAGLAGANALPRGLQGTVADIVDHVGVHLPSPTADHPGHPAPGVSGRATTTPSASAAGGGGPTRSGTTPTTVPPVSSTTGASPNATLPTVTVPTLPAATLPPLTLPKVTLPTLPSGKR